MRPTSEKSTLITTRPLAYVSVILKYYNYSFLKKYKSKYLKILSTFSCTHCTDHEMDGHVEWVRKNSKGFSYT